MINNLLDTNSFVEQQSLIPDANLIGGYGTVNDKLVYVYEQTGAVTVNHAKKISALYKKALAYGAPVIGFLNSDGLCLDSGFEALNAYGEIYSAQASASGVITQISVISGSCMGANAIMASFSDFVVTTADSAENLNFFLQSPAVRAGDSCSNYHVIYGETDGLDKVKEILGYIPFNAYDRNISEPLDDLNREDSSLNKDSSIEDIFSSICDNNRFIGIESGNKGCVSAVSKISGIPVGLIGADGCLSSADFSGLTKFVKYCDSLGLPIISITGTAGYSFDADDDARLLAEIGNFVTAVSGARVGKINLITGSALGSSYCVLNSKHLGMDVVYSWPDTVFALINSESSDKVLKTSKNFTAKEIAALGYIDDIVKQPATRKRIIAALQMVYSKNI